MFEIPDCHPEVIDGYLVIVNGPNKIKERKCYDRVKIKPSVAREIKKKLISSINQRKLDKKVSANYKDCLIKQSWNEETVCHIAFDYNGFCFDGQHRLDAVGLMSDNFEFSSIIWLNCNPKAAINQDTGRGRTLKDTIVIKDGVLKNFGDGEKIFKNDNIKNSYLTPLNKILEFIFDVKPNKNNTKLIEEYESRYYDAYDKIKKSNIEHMNTSGIKAALILSYMSGRYLPELNDDMLCVKLPNWEFYHSNLDNDEPSRRPDKALFRTLKYIHAIKHNANYDDDYLVSGEINSKDCLKQYFKILNVKE